MKKRLLSGLLVLVMLLTMLPISVLGDEVESVVDNTPVDATKKSSELTTDIGEKTFVVGVPVEFTFSTVANDDAGTMVVGTSNFSDTSAIEELEYLEVNDGNWYELRGDFGPSTGFLMSNATSTFRVTFNKAGTYTFTASMKTVDENATVLCSVNVAFTVLEHIDADDDGYCDVESCKACLHTKGENDLCTEEVCGHNAECTCGGPGNPAPGGVTGPEENAPAAPATTKELNALGLKVNVDCGHPDHDAPVVYDVLDGTWTAYVYDLEGEYYCSITVDAADYITAYDKDTRGIHTNATKNIPSFTLEYVDGAWKAVGAVVTFHVECVPDEPEVTYYTIKASSSKHGNVSSEGTSYVAAGSDKTYWFYPNKGYKVSAVYVDGYLVNYYGVPYDHYWDCDGCEDCWWIDWSEWYDCDHAWCDHDYCDDWYDCYYYDWSDWQDGITFYDVDDDHTLYVEFAPIDSGCPSDYYVDLNTDAWYHSATDYVIENDLMKGVGGKYFDPNGATTRGQLVTILYRLAGEPKVTGSSEFADVADGKWYTDAVIWAAKKGIVDGYGDGTFGVNDVITREQTVTILYRYAKYRGLNVSSVADLEKFLDAEDVSEYAEKPFGWAVKRDVIEGEPTAYGTKLDPQGTTARVEMAAMLMRYAEYVD